MKSEWEQIARRDSSNSTFALKIFKNKKTGEYLFEVTVDGALIADGNMSESDARSWIDK